jgi:hypothetical protein
MPNGLTVGGFSSANCSTICTVLRLCACAGFLCYILRVCQVHDTRVRFVDAETTSLKRGLPGGLTSSFFDRLRCRKSPARGFWTL